MTGKTITRLALTAGISCLFLLIHPDSACSQSPLVAPSYGATSLAAPSYRDVFGSGSFNPSAFGGANSGGSDVTQTARSHYENNGYSPIAFAGNDIMDIRNHTLFEYRRMFRNAATPSLHELIGTWRGVNKGVVQLAGYNQFIKEFQSNGHLVIGDNVQVHQVSGDMLRSMGWQPKTTDAGQLDRGDKFQVQSPRGISVFRHGAVISYRDGGNGKSDPVNLIVDKVVRLDANHLLGRATAKFGPLEIPLAYFVLERIE